MERYDVAIVGARCAGASLAAFLAREGVRVLVVDADPLGSDFIPSTHVVQQSGVAVLEELGVLDRIREVTPETRVLRMQVESVSVDIDVSEPQPVFAPRRMLLDTALQDAAAGAGAELRDRTKAIGVITHEGRVRGLRVRYRDGSEEEIAADVVVGADGRNSAIARFVGAEEYKTYTSPRPGYWAYWPAPPWFGTEAGHSFDLYFGLHRDRINYIFRADSNLLLLATTAPAAVCEEWRKGDHRAAYLRELRADPFIAPLIEDSEPVTQVRGAFREWFGYRRSAGPGWALVGDAGNAKDYTLGHGISDALLHARMLARAVVEGTDAALERYWRERDVHSLSLFRFAEDWGRDDNVTEFERILYAHVARSPELRRRIVAVNQHEVDPYDAFPVGRMALWALGGALRGKPQVLSQFRAMGQRAAAVKREVAEARSLLEAATLGSMVAPAAPPVALAASA